VELLNSQDIDFEQYLKLTEAHMKVKDASVFIDELKEDIVNPPKVVSCSMPWSKTIGEFNKQYQGMADITVVKSIVNNLINQ